MRRFTIGLLGLGACALLSLGGCSADRSAVAARLAPAQDKDEPEKKKDDARAFELPDDKAGRLLGGVLPPRPRQGALRPTERPTPPTVPAPKFAEPAATLPAGTALASRAPTPPRKGVLRPRVVGDEPFDDGLDGPALPRTPSFASEKLTSVPSEDAAIPPPPPILAVPTADRVGIDDFTLEASTEAALKAALPKRTTPAPFVKGGVPEPFENRKPLPTTTPPEETEPAAEGPAVPK